MARSRVVALTRLMLLYCALAPSATLAQSNYDQVENSIEFPSPDKGLPESTVLDGKVTKLDELSPVIFLNRTKAALNCAAGFMQIELKFEEPFYGRAYADFDRSSACTVTGKGNNTARIDLPLRGCGTKQDPLRVFTNNIVIRFHPFLEMDGDEVVTIVCRYPPPIAPPPPGIPNKRIVPPSPILEPPLKGFQILLIVCGILFLSLVLLGLGCSYYCLRNQQVQVVRRHPLSSVGSDKLSDSSLSMFDGLKIPRARAPTLDSSSSGSEMALVSAGDTLPSDYPSESPSSEPDDADGRSLRRSPSSGGSYENRAFQQQEEYVVERYQRESPPLPLPPVQPKFDVQLRVKRAPPPAPSPTPPPSESEASVTALERNLTTILERDETTATMTEERYRQPPVYSTVVRKDRDETEWYRQEETVTAATEKRRKSPPPPPPIQSPPQLYRTETEIDRYTSEARLEVFEPPVVPTKRPEITSHTVDDVFLKTITEKKTIEDVERHRREVVEYKPKPLPPPASWDVTIKNYPNPDAQYPQSGEDTATDWDSYSEASSVTGYPPPPLPPQPPPTSSQHQPPMQSRSSPVASPQSSRIHSYTHQQQQYSSTVADELHRRYLSTVDVSVPKPDNWESLVRVLEVDEPEPENRYRVERTLTLDDKRKWRRIITTESTLRRLITEATVREDFERIRNDPVHGSAFEPDKWDVIIRVIAPPPQQHQQHYDQKAGPGSSGGNRYTQKKKTTTEFEGTRTRRNSLPTVYEYDSDDDGSSVRTLTAVDDHGPLGPGARSRRTSRSSFKSDMDVRSMSEMTVDFRRPDLPDNYSDVSSAYNYYYQQQHHQQQHQSNRRGYYADDDAGSLVRSLSQPSLARSASEFTENWGVRLRSYEDGDDLSSNSSSVVDRTPRSSFREQGGPRRQYQQQQQYQQYQQQYSSATGPGTRRTMFGGPTVSAAEWFHEADDREPGYHQ